MNQQTQDRDVTMIGGRVSAPLKEAINWHLYDQKTTVQALLEEGLELVFQKYGNQEGLTALKNFREDKAKRKRERKKTDG